MVLVKEQPKDIIAGYFQVDKPGMEATIKAAKEVGEIKFATCRFSRIDDVNPYPNECTLHDFKLYSKHGPKTCLFCPGYVFTPKTKI